MSDGPGARLVRATPWSSVISLEGDGAEKFARAWIGTIRWICDDPLGTDRKRKNWFLGVEMIDLPDPGEIVIRDEDLKWETKNSSGNGGQHANKNETAVRLTHVPTGLTVSAEDERSRKHNRKLALERLAHALKDKRQVQAALLERINWQHHNELVRGNAVRTFVGLDFDER